METGLFAIIRVSLFILLSILILAFSCRSLKNTRSHGFYRFFAFEGILILILLNIPFWIKDPFSPRQIVSWVCLFFSLFFVIQGFSLLRKLGGSRERGMRSENYAFENTANLVTDGVYKYIRHPMYSSLLLLAWGAFLKHINIYSVIAVLAVTVSLMATAKIEEKENISFFGSEYEAYIRGTRMFIPYLF